MKKMRLNVDALTVTSFDIERKPEARGTVRGHATVQWSCRYCPSYPDATCDPGSCGYTCDVGLTGNPCVYC